MLEETDRSLRVNVRGKQRRARWAGIVAGASLAFACALWESAVAGDWPQHRFDSARGGLNPDETILSPSTVGNLKEIWSFTTDGLVTASPAVVDNVVYVPSGNGTFYALDAVTGALIWKRTIVGSSSSPAVANGVVYVGSGVDDGTFYALSAATGKILWQKDTGGIDSSPTVVDGVVYVATHRDSVIALDAATGSTIWTAPLDSSAQSSPAVVNGKVYVGTFGGFVYAIKAKNGHITWTNGDAAGAPIFGAPAVAKGLLYIGAGDGVLRALDSRTGATVWSVAGDGGAPVIYCSPAVAKGIVYAGFNTGEILAVDARTGDVAWKAATSGIVLPSPAAANRVLYVASQDNNLYAFRASNGAPLKKIGVSVDFSSPTVSNGRVFLGGLDHKVHAFGLED